MEPRLLASLCCYCGAPLYRLGDGMGKCSRCKKKYSVDKIVTDFSVIDAFCDGSNARSTAERLELNYLTVKKRYDLLRRLISQHLEERYHGRSDEIGEYEEYLYLESTKRHEQRHIFDAHNFITFDYGGWIYTIMMPSLYRHKQQFLADRLETLYYDEFSKFLRLNRIAKLQHRNNRITRFWEFFESFILQFRGVHPDNFPYYLKEAEFKFNYPPERQPDVLKSLWLASKKG